MRTRYFTVYAETSLPVYSDGTINPDATYAQDNITKYVVDEYEESGYIFNTRKYEVEDFHKIEQEHQPPEWQNHDW